MTSTKTAKIEDQIVLPSDNIGPNNNLKYVIFNLEPLYGLVCYLVDT